MINVFHTHISIGGLKWLYPNFCKDCKGDGGDDDDGKGGDDSGDDDDDDHVVDDAAWLRWISGGA